MLEPRGRPVPLGLPLSVTPAHGPWHLHVPLALDPWPGVGRHAGDASSYWDRRIRRPRACAPSRTGALRPSASPRSLAPRVSDSIVDLASELLLAVRPSLVIPPALALLARSMAAYVAALRYAASPRSCHRTCPMTHPLATSGQYRLRGSA